jgi:hypothetical protein
MGTTLYIISVYKLDYFCELVSVPCKSELPDALLACHIIPVIPVSSLAWQQDEAAVSRTRQPRKTRRDMVCAHSHVMLLYFYSNCISSRVCFFLYASPIPFVFSVSCYVTDVGGNLISNFHYKITVPRKLCVAYTFSANTRSVALLINVAWY